MDFCLFLGSYLNSITFSKVKLDTQTTKEDLKNNNLILIGGWFVNMVTKKMNELLSIKFNEKTKTIKSKVSQKEYGGRTIGIIYKTKNPFNKNKNILTISGIKKKGTESAILTFLKKFEEIEKGNVFNRKIHLKIIEGIDMNSDGGISEIEILE